MKNRKTENYVEVLKKVINIVNITPRIVILDFEKAERKAVQIVFPHAKIIGCFFHYSQVIRNNNTRTLI